MKGLWFKSNSSILPWARVSLHKIYEVPANSDGWNLGAAAPPLTKILTKFAVNLVTSNNLVLLCALLDLSTFYGVLIKKNVSVPHLYDDKSHYSIYVPSLKPEGLYKTRGIVRDLYTLSANGLEFIGSWSI